MPLSCPVVVRQGPKHWRLRCAAPAGAHDRLSTACQQTTAGEQRLDMARRETNRAADLGEYRIAPGRGREPSFPDTEGVTGSIPVPPTAPGAGPAGQPRLFRQ